MHDVWELGSDFHVLGSSFECKEHIGSPWEPHYVGCSAGRDPVSLLAERVTGRLWVPRYFCQEVISTWKNVGLSIVTYPDDPWQESDPIVLESAKPGDAILTVAYFGARAPRTAVVREGVAVLEDHTHDPWSDAAWTSRADFAFASLRKSVPIPDGAVLWSPLGKRLPGPPSGQRSEQVLDRLTAMLLKADYLVGKKVEKNAFRTCALRGEKSFADGPPAPMSDFSRSVLHRFDVARWRACRRANWHTFQDAFSGPAWIRLFDSGESDAPFCIVLVAEDAHRRNLLRTALVARNVYPAILWDLGGSVECELERPRADRMLALPCDGRYAKDDMIRLAKTIAEAGGSLR